MSVTSSGDIKASRNTDQEEYVRCSCGDRLVYLRREDGKLEMHWGWIHCTTCHKRDHKACQQCGRCLPESGLGFGLRSRFMKRSDVVRSDRNHCSNACRQRAYRQRKGANGA